MCCKSYVKCSWPQFYFTFGDSSVYGGSIDSGYLFYVSCCHSYRPLLISVNIVLEMISMFTFDFRTMNQGIYMDNKNVIKVITVEDFIFGRK